MSCVEGALRRAARAMRRIVIDADRIPSPTSELLGHRPLRIGPGSAPPCSSSTAKRSLFPTPTTTATSGAMSTTRVSEVTTGPLSTKPPKIEGGLFLCTLRPDSPFEEEHTLDERTHGEPSCVRCLFTRARPDNATDASHRSVVVVAVAGRPGLRHIPYLCHGARAAEGLLLRPAVSLPDAVLLAVHE